MSLVRLHSYFRSSTSIRVRAALQLKGLAYDYVAWNLRSKDHQSPAYLALNPQGVLPALEIDGLILTQSLPIIEYLEERFPDPPLLPADPAGRARVRALSAMIACDVHPLNNLRVLNHLKEQFGADEAAQTAWFRHWTPATLDPMEAIVATAPQTGRFVQGDTPGLADICIFAQMLNNRRFGIAESRWPSLSRIHQSCLQIPAFQRAMPEVQPDAS